MDEYKPTPEATELAIKREGELYQDIEKILKRKKINLDKLWIYLEAVRLYCEWEEMKDELTEEEVMELLKEAMVTTGMTPSNGT